MIHSPTFRFGSSSSVQFSMFLRYAMSVGSVVFPIIWLPICANIFLPSSVGCEVTRMMAMPVFEVIISSSASPLRFSASSISSRKGWIVFSILALDNAVRLFVKMFFSLSVKPCPFRIVIRFVLILDSISCGFVWLLD